MEYHKVFILTSLLLSSLSCMVMADSLLSCLAQHQVSNFSTPANGASFRELLLSSMMNLRFSEAGVASPIAIIYPASDKELQAAMKCCNAANVEYKVRGGGHSYEGLSSRSGGQGPFALIDLARMAAVKVDLESQSVFVQGGATLGELYYAIAQATDRFGFSAGVCPTVGVGGHIAGGGYGFLSRKYGTAADNVLDATLLTPCGEILQGRAALGDDLFWALRGGGGGSFGIVTSWRLKLAAVPTSVTTFHIGKGGTQQIGPLVYKWQSVAPAAPPELFLAVYLAGYSAGGATAELTASFYGQYLGTVNETLRLLGRIFPELGLSAADCKEGKWVDGVVDIAAIADTAALLSHHNRDQGYFKAKSDYVKTPLSMEALSGAFERLEANPNRGYMIFEPYGGVMDSIAANATPFPHRKGNLYNIQYQAVWRTQLSAEEEASLMNWVRSLYAYMEPFVSQSPRAAFINYIDLDLGTASTYGGALDSWGPLYFQENFPRLAHVKADVDPANILNNPQSIPPYSLGVGHVPRSCLK